MKRPEVYTSANFEACDQSYRCLRGMHDATRPDILWAESLLTRTIRYVIPGI